MASNKTPLETVEEDKQQHHLLPERLVEHPGFIPSASSSVHPFVPSSVHPPSDHPSIHGQHETVVSHHHHHLKHKVLIVPPQFGKGELTLTSSTFY